MKKKYLLAVFSSLFIYNSGSLQAQGWPANYEGVMLQGFYWDSFSDTKWSKLEKQADELSQYFDLVWVPQSGNCGGTSMGYNPLYYWDQNSTFGTEAQLRSFISTLKEKGTGVIADVVVNHRGNLSSWVDFPAETYKGVTYEMKSTDICANDDGGATRNWANSNGYSLSANNDEGEDWSGMRDLDHKSSNVQAVVKAYTKYLVEDLGYAGFRYDMVKGFGGSHVADYNRNAGVRYSVGEYWDGNPSNVKGWIDQTKVGSVPQSAAFDFPFRYTCRDAANGDWSKLKNASVASDAGYRQYAVTFVENHDTEYRAASAPQDPVKKDTLALNAWMLSMPGTPCVFLKHWQEWKEDIKNMIEMRHLVGINNQSEYFEWLGSAKYCGRTVDGSKGKLRILVGDYSINPSGYQLVLSGYHYKYFVSTDINSVWIDTPSGVHENGESLSAMLTAITADANAKIVYTTDGTTPSATNGRQVATGTKIEVSSTTILKAGLLINGTVQGVVSRAYQFVEPEHEDFDAYDLPVYVRSEVASFNNRMNFYVWAGEDNTQLNGGWPGKKITETVENGGYTWFTQSFRISSATMLPVNFVFSTGSGSPQTVDVTGVTQESWFVISSTQTGGKYKVTDVTAEYSGLPIVGQSQTAVASCYDLYGRRVEALESGRIYLRSGKKILIR